MEGENKNYLQHGFQFEFPQLTAPESLEKLLEVQILFPTTDLLHQKFCVGTSLPGILTQHVNTEMDQTHFFPERVSQEGGKGPKGEMATYTVDGKDDATDFVAHLSW